MTTAIKSNENQSGKINNRTNCKKGTCKRRGESPEIFLPSVPCETSFDSYNNNETITFTTKSDGMLTPDCTYRLFRNGW